MLPSNHSLIKPLLSIIQITYGSFEIYRTRWDQLTNYGYGAYYLICIPYIIMSFVNLVAALVCPEYPCVFLAESPIMQEARARGCTFNGTIGLADIGSSDPAGPSEPTEPAGGPSPEWQGLLLVSSRTPGISDPSRSAPDEALPPIQLVSSPAFPEVNPLPNIFRGPAGRTLRSVPSPRYPQRPHALHGHHRNPPSPPRHRRPIPAHRPLNELQSGAEHNPATPLAAGVGPGQSHRVLCRIIPAGGIRHPRCQQRGCEPPGDFAEGDPAGARGGADCVGVCGGREGDCGVGGL